VAYILGHPVCQCIGIELRSKYVFEEFSRSFAHTQCNHSIDDMTVLVCRTSTSDTFVLRTQFASKAIKLCASAQIGTKRCVNNIAPLSPSCDVPWSMYTLDSCIAYASYFAAAVVISHLPSSFVCECGVSTRWYRVQITLSNKSKLACITNKSSYSDVCHAMSFDCRSWAVCLRPFFCCTHTHISASDINSMNSEPTLTS